MGRVGAARLRGGEELAAGDAAGWGVGGGGGGERGGVGVAWAFRGGRATWPGLSFREEAAGLLLYLERPILRVELFDFDSNYNRGGDAMFESWSDDAMETEAIYFGLGEDAVLLWKEGEEVDLPAATAAQEEMWAIAELPPQEVPQE